MQIRASTKYRSILLSRFDNVDDIVEYSSKQLHHDHVNHYQSRRDVTSRPPDPLLPKISRYRPSDIQSEEPLGLAGPLPVNRLFFFHLPQPSLRLAQRNVWRVLSVFDNRQRDPYC